ncbi:hypothetical protein FOMG_09079 [Fusarium oxysporum f. sp. melonis 26406]|uniref:Uncharacterized protein n=1 Tax=Fusarium oxysporum f. sp. melonis 26406 TaxID=1089452 RepID=X0ARZ9_FUSOX|nr:hypothetical protein FOMG_09079 [Fusarium oxysporum f. sp. melonis 26406]
MQTSTLYTFPIPIEFENPLLYAMYTNQTPAVSQAASTKSDREEWLGAMAEHAKYEAFRNRIRNFLLNLNTMRESLQINSRIAGPDTELDKAMVALSDEMFDKTRKMDKGVTILNKIYTEVDLRKPLIEAHLELGAGSAVGTLAETQIALDHLKQFGIVNTLLKRMWEGLLACSRRGHLYLRMARSRVP